MEIGGFRIQVTGVPSGPFTRGPVQRPARSERPDGSDIGSLSWLLMDPEPLAAASPELCHAVSEGSYRVPAREFSRSLIEEHVFVKP